jgi:hypothetical protein
VGKCFAGEVRYLVSAKIKLTKTPEARGVRGRRRNSEICDLLQIVGGHI